MAASPVSATVDRIVVNAGTRPLDDLYFALKPLSCNYGEVGHDDLIAGRPQQIKANPDGGFSCSALATPWRRATPMLRSMTRCAS